MRPYFISLTILVATAPAFGADAVCTGATEAAKKLITTPAHAYLSRTMGSRPNQTELSEIIYTGGINGAIFVMLKGQWKRSPATPAQMLKQEEENIRDSKSSCRYLRDEVVDGEPARVYQIHSDNDGIIEDATAWISKSRGLPLKQEIDMDVGGGASGKSHTSTRYEYSNIRPPEGVK